MLNNSQTSGKICYGRLETDGMMVDSFVDSLLAFVHGVKARENKIKVVYDKPAFGMPILTFQEIIESKTYEDLEKENRELKEKLKILQNGTPKPTAPPNREVWDDPRHRSSRDRDQW